MPILITISLALNVAVLLPVCASMFWHAAWTEAAYGQPGPARGILLSVYLAILALSAGLLVRPDPSAVAALLALQVLYKLMTPLTVGSLANPVVTSNLIIAAVHACTLFTIAWR